jgi:cytochrome c553
LRDRPDRHPVFLDLTAGIVFNKRIQKQSKRVKAMKKLFLIAFSSGLLFSQAAFAADMPAKAKTCVGCHGVDGNSVVPNFPKLAGQHAQYLEKALKDFRDGFRKDATMQAFAKNLSDKEIKELADYYASQKAK